MSHELPQKREPRYELTDAPVGTIIRWAAGLTVSVVVVCLGIVGLFRLLVSMERLGERNPLAPAHQIPPEPRLMVEPAGQLKEIRVHEEQVLDSYGWVDRQKGIVRIPIERAMDLTIERGLPVRKESPPK